MKRNEYDHSRLVDLIQKRPSSEIPSTINEISNIINVSNINKVLLSSEKFLELAVYDMKKIQNIFHELGKEYDLSIIYIKRNINEIVDSGIRHFLSIMNKKHILHYSKYFEFDVNPINYYFDFNDVRQSMLKWIQNAYFIIDKINIKKLSLEYSYENIPLMLNRIFEIDQKLIMNVCQNYTERYNSYPVSDSTKLKEYMEFCKKNYMLKQYFELISYNEFKT